MNLQAATGYYANFFDEKGLDIFVILNESNPIPTTDDFIFIENTITESISKYACFDEDKVKQILDSYFPAGVQIVNHSTGYVKL